jgi:hypothetical protein
MCTARACSCTSYVTNDAVRKQDCFLLPLRALAPDVEHQAPGRYALCEYRPAGGGTEQYAVSVR